MLTVFTAAYEGKLFIVQQLIEKDASAATSRDEDQRTPLHWAASGGHANIVNYLLTLHVPIDALDESGWSPLMIAASAGHLDAAEALLTQGANAAVENESGQTAL
ncbi:ankyrin repeat-containing domain protein [Syncephalastrum racemosum]|uniref:Ankyrin repeat-containing domain protein n=1 Tax=Syncephalastrum racemosum TaxID=13706 RepID=A0A1X2H6B9_SYNRA|nr:ankyrin repeat-containing domain protein [Syncephalastrum racemosum]